MPADLPPGWKLKYTDEGHPYCEYGLNIVVQNYIALLLFLFPPSTCIMSRKHLVSTGSSVGIQYFPLEEFTGSSTNSAEGIQRACLLPNGFSH